MLLLAKISLVTIPEYQNAEHIDAISVRLVGGLAWFGGGGYSEHTWGGPPFPPIM